MHVDAFEITTSDHEDLERDDEDGEEVATLQEEYDKEYDEALSGKSAVEDGEVVNEKAGEEGINRHAWENETWSIDSDDFLVILLQFNQHENRRYGGTNLLIDTGSTCFMIINKKNVNQREEE